MPTSPRTDTAPDRFATKHRIDARTGCWLWTAAVAGNGYGAFHDGVRSVGAHHFSWRLHRGLLPDGMYVCHECDSPTCVNPDHLFLDTPSGNQQDAVRKGRAKAGRAEWKHPEALKKKIQADPRPYREIAGDFGLSFNAVKSIKSMEGRGLRAARIGSLRTENAKLREALKIAQAALAMLTNPDAIKNTSVQHAWAHAVEAEARVRTALAKVSPTQEDNA